MTDAERRNLNVITDVCDAFNEHDADAIMAHFAEGAVWPVSRGEPPEGGRLEGKGCPVVTDVARYLGLSFGRVEYLRFSD